MKVKIYSPLLILLVFAFYSCKEEVVTEPENPCLNMENAVVSVNSNVVFKLCSDADIFTLWPGDEGHKYENYGIDKGIQFTNDSLVYAYPVPGEYTITLVAINSEFNESERNISTYTINVVETTADFEYFAYEAVFPPIEGEKVGDSIILTVPFKTDVSDMVMTFEAGFAEVYVDDSLQVSGVTSNDFREPVNYSIFSWDGNATAEYTVRVKKVPPKTENELFSFGFQGINDQTTIDHDSLIIKSVVPAGTSINNLVAEFTVSESAIVKVDGQTQISGSTANNFLQDVKYNIIAEDGSIKTYDVEIEFAPSDRNNFLYFAFTDPQVVGEIDNEEKTIIITVPEGTDVSSMQPVISTSKGSTVYIGGEVQVSGESVVDFTNPVYYVVEAENGDIALYKVTVLFSN